MGVSARRHRPAARRERVARVRGRLTTHGPSRTPDAPHRGRLHLVRCGHPGRPDRRPRRPGRLRVRRAPLRRVRLAGRWASSCAAPAGERAGPRHRRPSRARPVDGRPRRLAGRRRARTTSSRCTGCSRAGPATCARSLGDDRPRERPGDGPARRPRRGPRSPTRARRSSPGSSTSTTVRWAYEPDTFPIGWNLDGDVIESFSPDFYLPDLELYVELTTLKQKLVRKKNRKLRRLRELYPGIRIKLFYARDFRMLLLKFGRLALLDELTGTTGQSTPPRLDRRRTGRGRSRPPRSPSAARRPPRRTPARGRPLDAGCPASPDRRAVAGSWPPPRPSGVDGAATRRRRGRGAPSRPRSRTRNPPDHCPGEHASAGGAIIDPNPARSPEAPPTHP